MMLMISIKGARDLAPRGVATREQQAAARAMYAELLCSSDATRQKRVTDLDKGTFEALQAFACRLIAIWRIL